MEQFEQLLTCAICLDRYRNPKLLPCQHSFCMEPCLEGLVDYVRRQIKCPECRAEHRIPYQGVQGYPTNVTLQRFLELHIEITGELPDPTSGQVMERCNVCSEKAYCTYCWHCDKKICEECKGAHMDILRREITRINNQIRRGVHRLQDSLALVEKNTQNIQTNCLSVGEEVDEIYRRLSKALKDRTDHLRGELDRYLGTELRTLTALKDNLEQEISNILSNCDLADKHMSTDIWDDCELMDTKEIFLKTVEFIRNFECENSDYTRKIRLILAHDPNQLVLHVASFGDLNIGHLASSSSLGLLQTPGAPGLMRSKSDHRLASQFRQQQEDNLNAQEDTSRKFGERSKLLPSGYYGDDYENETRPTTRSRFSRFRRHVPDNDSDTDQSNSRGIRHTDHHPPAIKERERVLDTEDVARGPLSGITRLVDSPRVMKKLQENPTNKKKEKEPPPVPLPVAKSLPKRTAQNRSEDDEISKIKKQNKATTSTATENTSEIGLRANRESSKTPVAEANAETSDDTGTAEELEDEEGISSLQQTQRSTATSKVALRTPPSTQKKTLRSTSTDSNTSTESAQPRKASITGASFTTDELKQKLLVRANSDKTSVVPVPKGRGFVQQDEDDTETSSSTSEEDSDDDEDQDRDDDADEDSVMEDVKKKTSNLPSNVNNKDVNKSDIGPLLARSAHARDNSTDLSRTYQPKSSYRSNTNHSSTTNNNNVNNADSTRYNYTSRFLNKSKSSAVLPQDEDPPPTDQTRYTNGGEEPSGRSRYMALKERRQRLARSRSTQQFGGDEEEPEEPSSTTNPNTYLASRGYGTAATNDLSRSRSTHTLKSRDNSPDPQPRPSTTLNSNEKDGGAALSSWARYLKNKYGNRNVPAASSSSTNAKDNTNKKDTSSSSSSSTNRRLSLGLPLRNAQEVPSSDDDQKNMQGSPTTPPTTTPIGIGTGTISPNHIRGVYVQKGEQQFEIGSRGSDSGHFTWPRGVAISTSDQIIAVADSSNHRVQIFDLNGRFQKEFGQYGSGDGEFDCLAGLAINRIGQYIIADRYNHRIQVFDPSGRYLRAFGSQGTADGRFNYPWGVATDALGFIYVCDKENHRIQIFQSDGTFVGKFGTMGSREGQLEHPHYIAVSSNRIVVSDSNNHRIQVFDPNTGKILFIFGAEGSGEGQFKFPRGVDVDEYGYICVADSGNNRVQIFHPDGTFLKAFGSWGCGRGEFKALEGVALSSNGSILVCDRENHRIQVF